MFDRRRERILMAPSGQIGCVQDATWILGILITSCSSSFSSCFLLLPAPQVAQMFDQVKPAGGKFNYGKFTRIMKRGSDE